MKSRSERDDRPSPNEGPGSNGLGEDDGSQTEGQVVSDQRGELVVVEPGGDLASLTSRGTVPGMVAAAGERAIWRFVEFFTANIRNGNTRVGAAVALDIDDIYLMQAIKTTCSHRQTFPGTVGGGDIVVQLCRSG